MPDWDISQTRTLIEARHGVQQAYLVRNCLRSVTERLRHARYHFQEAKRLLKEHIDDRLPTESIYSVTWPTQPEERSTLDNCLMMVEANIIASAQAVHSIADNLAHVVYFALGMNIGAHPLREREVTIYRVARELADSKPEHAEVEYSLKALLADTSFKAIEAFVNVTKHRGFSETRLHLDPPECSTPYLMEFGAFAHQDKHYPEREIEEVVAPAYAAASRAVVETGNALNRALSP